MYSVFLNRISHRPTFLQIQLIIWYRIINQGYILPDNLCQVWFWNFVVDRGKSILWGKLIFLFAKHNQFYGKINWLLLLLQQHSRFANSWQSIFYFWVTRATVKKIIISFYNLHCGTKITLISKLLEGICLCFDCFTDFCSTERWNNSFWDIIFLFVDLHYFVIC